MPGTSNVDAADPFAYCSMTAPDDDGGGGGAPDLLAELQASVDRARGRTPVDPSGRLAPQPTPAWSNGERSSAMPPHPAGQTVEQALAYVDDTVELRTPTERALARGYRALQAAYGESQRRMHDQDAELLVVRDACATASDERDAATDVHGGLARDASAIARAWRDYRAAGATTGADLDELVETLETWVGV